MSYEGSVEYLCLEGHYSRRGCWDEDLKECPFCAATIAHRHAIDHTNGVIEDQPYTMPAPKQQVGYDDDWREDHYGNRYAVKIPRYAPGSEWHKMTLA